MDEKDREPQEPLFDQNQGPDLKPGGTLETGALIPPYEGRQTQGKEVRYIDRDVEKTYVPRPDGEIPPQSEGTGPSHYWGTNRGEDRVK